MPSRALLVAKPAEVEALSAALAGREDLDAVPCTRGSHVFAALAAKAPDVALIRLRLADVDGLDILHRLRAVAPGARVFLLLDENEAAHREACFRSGCEDVLFAPIDPAEVVRQLAGGDEFRFRREPRVPLGTSASLTVGGAVKEVVAESLSELGLRLRWSEPPPVRAVVPITLRLDVGDPWPCWVRLEEVASRKGTPDALMARFMGLNAAERGSVRAALNRLRGVRGGPLEAPSVPVTYAHAPEAEASTGYKELPKHSLQAPSRRRFTGALAGIAGVAALGSASWAWITLQDVKHPDRRYDPKPERIVEGLRIRRVNRTDQSVIAMADASWWDLSEEGRGTAVTALAREVGLDDRKPLEVWTVRGRVAAATMDSAGAISIVQEPR